MKSSELSPYFLSECVRTFNEWIETIKQFPNWLEGNLVAALISEKDESMGSLSILKTAFLSKAQAETVEFEGLMIEDFIVSRELRSLGNVKDIERRNYLGMQACCPSIHHGNVVAFYCAAQKRFLRILDSKASFFTQKKDILKLPRGWDSERFLVISLGGGRFAFYSICHSQLLAMAAKQVIGIPCAKQLDSLTADERFKAEIPSEAIFVVNPERSDQSAVSLYSEKYQNYITMTDVDVSGDGKKPRAEQTFDIVLVMTRLDRSLIVPQMMPSQE
jgi:hypothetical protein